MTESVLEYHETTLAEEPNDFLKALPAEEYARLRPALEVVSLEVKTTIYVPNQVIRHIYFPRTAILSILALDNENAVEVATVGKEGMVGLPVFHGIGVTPHQCLVQVAGESYYMPVESFRAELPGLPYLRALLHRYSVSTFNEAGQSILCNRLHEIEARCARWLLATHDRVNGSEFSLAQEFLAYMLATRRPAVSEACSHLQRAGLIAYTRTKIRVLDRAGLEAAACTCYQITRRSHAMVLDPLGSSGV